MNWYKKEKNNGNKYTLNKNDIILIFIVALTARLVWALFSGVPVDSGGDFPRYDIFSDNIVNGNLNLKLDSFIVAPLFPYIFALFKYLSGKQWIYTLGGFQITLSAIASVYAAKTAWIIFKRRSISITSGLVYSLTIPTLYYVHTATQESLFQSIFIISIFYATSYCNSRNTKDLILFSILFTLSLLTKSHVILSIPLWSIMIFMVQKNIKKRLIDNAILFIIIVTMTLPYGLYNLQANGMYVISSSGGGYHFLTGHNDDFYKFMVNTPKKGTKEYTRLVNMEYPIFEEAIKGYNLTHKGNQKKYLEEGINWIKSNPIKYINLSVYNLLNHLRPGYSFKFHEFMPTLISLIFLIPIYILAYIELIKSINESPKHYPAYVVFLTMIFFVFIFYSQNRFRVITVEPIYLIYASPSITRLLKFI